MKVPEKIEGKKKVEVFNLSSDSQRVIYEDLLNSEKVSIIREEFTYLKTGAPVITVWYIKKTC